MADEQGKPNFWTTLPGILTGIAAVLTAAGGIILGLHQMGGPGAGQGHADNVAPSSVSTPGSETVPSQPQSAASSPSVSPVSGATTPPPAGDDIPTKAVRITKTDGTVLWSFEDKFDWGGENFEFDNGQLVPFGKVKAVDVLGVDDDHGQGMKVQLTLTNGKAIEGFSHPNGRVYGKNDIGDIIVDIQLVKRITFPR
jgi:hypothetical protein